MIDYIFFFEYFKWKLKKEFQKKKTPKCTANNSFNLLLGAYFHMYFKTIQITVFNLIFNFETKKKH